MGQKKIIQIFSNGSLNLNGYSNKFSSVKTSNVFQKKDFKNSEIYRKPKNNSKKIIKTKNFYYRKTVISL